MAKFYTVKETSLILGYSTNTVYKLLDENRIKATRGSAHQGRFRISHSALEDFLKCKLPQDPLAGLTLEPKNIQVKKEFETNPPTEAKTIKSPPPTPPSTINLTRALVVFGLVLLLLDLFFSRDFSILQQGLRLILMSVILLLSYISGSLSNPSHS